MKTVQDYAYKSKWSTLFYLCPQVWCRIIAYLPFALMTCRSGYFDLMWRINSTSYKVPPWNEFCKQNILQASSLIVLSAHTDAVINMSKRCWFYQDLVRKDYIINILLFRNVRQNLPVYLYLAGITFQFLNFSVTGQNTFEAAEWPNYLIPVLLSS